MVGMIPGNTGPLRPKPTRRKGGGRSLRRKAWLAPGSSPTRAEEDKGGVPKAPQKDSHFPLPPSSIRTGHCCKSLFLISRFSHLHLPVALRRLGRAGRGAGEPGPASGVAASASGTQVGPGLGGRPPAPQAASGPARGSPPGPF